MRQKQQDILPGFFHDNHLNDDDETKTLQIVRRFREEYKRVDALLQKYPEILEAAHRDLKKLCKPDAMKKRKEQNAKCFLPRSLRFALLRSPFA